MRVADHRYVNVYKTATIQVHIHIHIEHRKLQQINAVEMDNVVERTWIAVHLLLWNDNLSGEGVFRVGNCVVEEADAANNLTQLKEDWRFMSKNY